MKRNWEESDWNYADWFEIEKRHAGLKDHEIEYLMLRKNKSFQEES